MSTAEWIRLGLSLAAVAISISAAVAARQAATQARAAARRAWGDVARSQLARMKIEQLRRRASSPERGG